MENNSDMAEIKEPSFNQKARAYFKNLPKRYFIDAFTGMAQGLFVTLIAGTIVKKIGDIIGDNAVGRIFVLLGQIASILMGAGIGAGIASYLKAPRLVVFSAIVAGFLGAYAEQALGAKITYSSIYVGMDGNISVITATLAKGLPGNPISAYVCSLMAVEIGTLVQGKTKLDILLVPLTCTLTSFVGCFVSIPFIYLVSLLSKGIAVSTGAVPFVMGVVIAVVMGVLLTMPTSSAAIWVAIATPIINGGAASEAELYNIYLAGGAAVVGCSCHMIGFAVMSLKENGVGGLISQGLGTSMLQIPNIMKKPILLLPPVISSAICGPLSTCVFKLLCNASGGGMGTSGLVGVFGVIAEECASMQNPVTMWLGIVLLMFVLPAVLNLLMSEFMRKKGLIKENDLKLDL
ncbi:MAG: PTS sugar transporter subunit IIC [Christensenellaceae bacterium]|nr:PTS sugar transporter subunit IIC [Christensenellaceae bacterium]MDD6926937.1 PTS sugar transporter subunit IIC [bacterium]MDY2850659.1 PTS sugar transporter subunit IIC [Christensenellaceae bacterium]